MGFSVRAGVTFSQEIINFEKKHAKDLAKFKSKLSGRKMGFKDVNQFFDEDY